jgi:hypothetical protein
VAKQEGLLPQKTNAVENENERSRKRKRTQTFRKWDAVVFGNGRHRFGEPLPPTGKGAATEASDGWGGVARQRGESRGEPPCERFFECKYCAFHQGRQRFFGENEIIG